MDFFLKKIQYDCTDIGSFYSNTSTNKRYIRIENISSNSSSIVPIDISLTVAGDLLINRTNVLNTLNSKADQSTTYAKPDTDTKLNLNTTKTDTYTNAAIRSGLTNAQP